jgi:hypothetical protein
MRDFVNAQDFYGHRPHITFHDNFELILRYMGSYAELTHQYKRAI